MANSRTTLNFIFCITTISAATAQTTHLSSSSSSNNQSITTPFYSSSSSSTCDMAYGFMPCSTTSLGSSFLILVYGLVMHFGSSSLSGGTESVHEIVGPNGLTTGVFLSVINSFPNAALVLASGLNGGSNSAADSQVLVGIGLMTGSTVLLLTAVWGSCVVFGKCDIDEDSNTMDGTDTKGYSLTGSGVSCEKLTTHSSKIMSVSLLPFIVSQLPQLVSSDHQSLTIFLSFLTCISLFLSYSLFQVFQPWIHNRRVEYVHHKHNRNYNYTTTESHQLEEPLNNTINGVSRPGTITITRTGLKLLLGTLTPAAISKPLVNASTTFSTTTGIPSFFVSFILLPFTTSITHIVSTYIFSKRKDKKSTSLTLEMIYGTVTMNNVVSLSTFLGVVYFKSLTWEFSGELLTVVVVGVVMGGFCSFRTKFPLWSSILAFSLYPISVLVVYLLVYVVDWS